VTTSTAPGAKYAIYNCLGTQIGNHMPETPFEQQTRQPVFAPAGRHQYYAAMASRTSDAGYRHN